MTNEKEASATHGELHRDRETTGRVELPDDDSTTENVTELPERTRMGLRSVHPDQKESRMPVTVSKHLNKLNHN